MKFEGRRSSVHFARRPEVINEHARRRSGGFPLCTLHGRRSAARAAKEEEKAYAPLRFGRREIPVVRCKGESNCARIRAPGKSASERARRHDGREFSSCGRS